MNEGSIFASALRPEMLDRWHEGYFTIVSAETSEPLVEEPCVWQFFAAPNGLASLRFGRDINVQIPGDPSGFYLVHVYVADMKRNPVMTVRDVVRVNNGTVIHFVVDKEST